MLMGHFWKRITAAVLIAVCLCVCTPAPARAADIQFLSYEESLPYFNFDRAVDNWCTNFGLDYETEYITARDQILAGTDRDLIIGLATYARDTGHGEGSLLVTNAFRPASYQEIIGLHDANYNTGPFRNSLTWNGKSIPDFWWNAETSPGWPESCTIDLSAYDVTRLDPRYFYRSALKLWDNGWVNAYYARPGNSAHNSGTAIDIGSDWIALDFAVEHTYNGVTCKMEDYGLFKPLQPTEWSAGEPWHITSKPTVYALSNYDMALESGYEIAYGLYYNPASRGWSMADSRGIYLGAGVTVIQLRLCQLGLLEPKYITGYYCSATENAVKAFQSQYGLEADGICGSGTIRHLMAEGTVLDDYEAPAVTLAQTLNSRSGGFDVQVQAEDDKGVSYFRVETRKSDSALWVPRCYSAEKTGGGLLDVDIWEEGWYDLRVSAVDYAGNRSPDVELEPQFVDGTMPRFDDLRIGDITDTGFTITARGSDNVSVAGYKLVLKDSEGTETELSQTPDEWGDTVFGVTAAPGTEVSVYVSDYSGNTRGYTFSWTYEGAEPGVSIAHHSAR